MADQERKSETGDKGQAGQSGSQGGAKRDQGDASRQQGGQGPGEHQNRPTPRSDTPKS